MTPIAGRILCAMTISSGRRQGSGYSFLPSLEGKDFIFAFLRCFVMTALLQNNQRVDGHRLVSANNQRININFRNGIVLDSQIAHADKSFG